MKYIQLILFYLNLLVAMGFSLIAPLIPPLCKEKGISNQICSYIISSICFTQILATIYAESFIQKLGTKKLFLISLIGQSACIFYYGFMVYINKNYIFIITGFINRLFHGIFDSFISIIIYSLTSLINKGKELEKAMAYMELCWGVGLAIGTLLIGIVYQIGGHFLPFIIVVFLDLTGVYLFYEIPEKEMDDSASHKKSSDNLESFKNEKSLREGKDSFLNILSYSECLIFIGCLMLELNTTDFFVPTLVNYLKDEFSIRTSRASLFFLASTLGFILVTQIINKLTDLFNNFKLIFIGQILASICCLLTAPIGFLPHKYIFIIVGIFFQGFLGGIINILTFLELNNFGKRIYYYNPQLQRDIPSSIYNFSFFIGDLIEPVIGSWITSHFNFQTSAYVASFGSLSMAVIFGIYFFDKIKKIEITEKEVPLLENEEAIINI